MKFLFFCLTITFLLQGCASTSKSDFVNNKDENNSGEVGELIGRQVVSESRGARFDKSISDLVGDFSETGDTSYLGVASLRCGAFNNVVHGVMQRDSPRNDWSMLESRVDDFISIGLMQRQAKAGERGLSYNDDYFIRQISDEFSSYSDVYSKWMRDNYLAQGEYIGSSAELKEEFNKCLQLHEAMK